MTKPPPTPDETWTMLRALNWTASYFASCGIDSPRSSAEILLAHSLGLQRIDLYVRYDQPLQDEELRGFKSLIRRRVAREPVAYITGEREFWSMPLLVTPAVLIPRPETERLVEAAAEALPEAGTLRMLEPGSGSGAVSIALATERPSLRIFASDRSAAALSVAGKNAARHGVAERIEFFVGDWLCPVSDKAAFDAVVCNPPYVPSGEIDSLQPEVSRFEPRRALDGGPDGLDAVRRLAADALGCLKPGGTLLFEIGFDQGPAACRIVAAAGGFAAPVVLKDYAGKDRVIRVCKR
ncbi:MAG: peptide chain release factor N(5)-glutamine methyltransferase [Desulfobacterales bacterium]|jgi:release factor glutamine methyltransferase